MYEAKSFTQLLTASQRNQVEKSLATAQRKRPQMTAWTLALPEERDAR